MADVGGELQDVGQMALLPGGPRWRDTLKRSHQRLVVREDVEHSTLQEEPEVSEGHVYGQELPVKGGVACLRGGELL